MPRSTSAPAGIIERTRIDARRLRIVLLPCRSWWRGIVCEEQKKGRSFDRPALSSCRSTLRPAGAFLPALDRRLLPTRRGLGLHGVLRGVDDVARLVQGLEVHRL